MSEVTLERSLNSLLSREKSQAKQAIVSIQKLVTNSSDSELKSLYERCEKSLLGAVESPVEACRERAVALLSDFMKRMEPDRRLLVLLVPVVCARFVSEQRREYSEEVRLELIHLMGLLVKKHPVGPGDGGIAPYVDQLIEALVVAIGDEAPAVRRDSCAVAETLFATAPIECFRHTQDIVSALLLAVRHQHSKVRQAVVAAIGGVLKYGDGKVVPEATNTLARRLFDDSPVVRSEVVKVIGDWLLNLHDRYSFFPVLLPHILTSLVDSNDGVKAMAERFWLDIGKQYLSENEKDYKEKLDFLDDYREHYPPDTKRPSFGCRELVNREGYKFLPALASELTDWTEQVRIKSAQLLSQVILHVEHGITQHICKILVAMTKAASDSTETVRVFVIKSAMYIGYFVPVEVYGKLIVENISDTPNYGELAVVAAMVSGSVRETLKPHISNFKHLFSTSTIKSDEQAGQLELIHWLMTICAEDSLEIVGEEIWCAIVSIAGLAGNSVIADRAAELMEVFIKLGGGDRLAVHKKYCHLLFKKLKSTPVWTVACHQQFIFGGILNIAGEVIWDEDHMKDVIEILAAATDEKNDAEVILKMLLFANRIIDESKELSYDKERVYEYIQLLIKDVLCRVLIWRPGKSAQALRAAGALCLCTCLNSQENPVTFLPEDFLPTILSLAEDDCPNTRSLAIASLSAIIGRGTGLDEESFHKSAIVLTKRFDDCDSKVRKQSICALKNGYKHLKEKHDNDPSTHIHSGLLEHVYTVLLIHLDDQDPTVQETVFECLQAAVEFKPPLLWDLLKPENFRDKSICERVKALIQSALQRYVPLSDDQAVDTKSIEEKMIDVLIA